VHDQIEALALEKVMNANMLANIKCYMREAFRYGLQSFQIPKRVASRAKKHAAHIIVDASDFMPGAIKMLHGLRTD
jgi:hypothetical protein